MKRSVMLIITLVAALFVQPTLADDAHHHEKGAQASHDHGDGASERMGDHESMMQDSMSKMHDQMESIKRATDPDERRKLLQEHSESMRESIKMMREMMGGMTMGGGMGSCHMMHGQSAGQHAAGHSQPEQIAPSKKNTSKSGKQLWDCPMHPEVVQDHPGVCPKCGMDLVKKGQLGASKSGHDHKMDGCMMGSGKKGGCKKGGCKKGSCMKGGGMKPGLVERQINMILMLMEQMIEHNDAAMALQK